MTGREWQGRLRSAVYPLYETMPPGLKAAARAAFAQLAGPMLSKKARWIHHEYAEFARERRREIFLDIAFFANVNRPIEGYYFEFGSYKANTMRLAHDNFRHLFDWHYVAFDSFEGLPEIDEIDKQVIWEKGKLKMTEQDFVKVCTRHGIPRDRLTTVKGFYDTSLTEELKQRLLPRKAAVVYVDCDLYQSTVPVLRFIKDFLQPGTVVVFDDWNCFLADPDRGERRAWREFLAASPELRFEPFVSKGMQASFIFTGGVGEKGTGVKPR
jgi:O-methyltransferase